MINDPDDSLDGVLERLIAMPDADVGRGASRAEIADAEAKLATKIPSEYRAFLLRVGWGGCDGWELLGLGEGVRPTFTWSRSHWASELGIGQSFLLACCRS